MRHYEVLLLINPDQSNQIPAMIERYGSMVTKNGGQIHRKEDWGKLPLAYPINKLHKAHYVLFNFECSPQTLIELNHNFKFNDAIIRNLVTKCEAAITEKSIFMKNRESEQVSKDNTYVNPQGSGANMPLSNSKVVSPNNHNSEQQG